MKPFVSCLCHCRKCGSLLGGGICPECSQEKPEEKKTLSLPGLIFAAVLALTLLWLILGKAY
jgi:hypothetical protein